MEGLLKVLLVLCFIATCNGSCSDLGLGNTGCCTLSDCYSSTDQCYCDVSCYTHDDCCPDITEIGCNPPETTKCNNTDIRLVDGFNDNEGRVEVCVNEHWGTVCSYYWTYREATVVCKQLGINGVSVPRDVSYFGSGTGPISMGTVYCTGNEDNLTQCRITPQFLCGHFYDVGVSCDSAPECNDTDIRLVGGSNDNEGRVEVCVNGAWGTVCGDSWDSDDAAVVCRQLGLGSTGIHRIGYFGPGSGNIVMVNVQCNGTEDLLVNCLHYTTHQCIHSQDAGISCISSSATITTTTTTSVTSTYKSLSSASMTLVTTPSPSPTCTSGSIRLVDGSSANEGRVEVCINGAWGTVCDDLWGPPDARVVCRQLGIDGTSIAHTNAYFGAGTGPINMDNVQCTGNEGSLVNCTYLSTHNCGHSEDAGVTCGVQPECIHGDIRLVGGSNANEGRVEVCVNGEWGTVCDDGWDNDDAAVVCRQLGLGINGVSYSSAYYGSGTGLIVMDDVHCDGTEQALVNCSHTSDHNCFHSEDAGVRCIVNSISTSAITPTPSPINNCISGNIRLVGGSNDNEGRVEVCINGAWGTVCDDLWGAPDAAVVCNQLGIDGNSIARTNAYFGAGTGPINMDNVQCTGNEGSLVNCTYSSTHNCGHFEDAGVTCGVTPQCNNSDIRLVGGSNDNEGRVEMCINYYWRTLCASAWRVYEASLVCKQLGINGISVPRSGTYFSPGTVPTVLSEHVFCVGNEDNFTQCTTGLFPLLFCANFNVGVTCGAQPECNDTDIRLVGGSNANEGRVEVCVNGLWGTVCHDYWGSADAAVVCNQLGIDGNSIARTNAYFGAGTGPINMDNVQCTGNEGFLVNCTYLSTHNCGHFEDAGVTCGVQPECNNTDIRLVGGSNANEGRVEVCVNGEWGTVCDDGWNNNDAAVVCRQLGLGINGVSYSRAYYGQGNGSIVMDEVNCTGTEESLFQCAYTQIHDCRHYEDAGVKCIVSEISSSSISVIVRQTSTILNTASPSSTPLQGSCLSLNLPYTGCCNSSNGSRTKCYNGCYCDASCYLFGDCCDDIEDIGCLLKPSFSISATSSGLFLSSTIRTSKQSSTSTIIKTSVKDSSSFDVPSVATPAVVVENALKASIPGINKDTFTDERQSQFKQATANSINKYCSANPDNCIGVSRRKKQNGWTPLTESDIIIFSISNTNDGVDIAFYAATSSETVLPVRALETAVQAGIDDGTYHSYGFDKVTAAPLRANNPTVAGNEKKGGNSTAIIGGVVAFICVALLVIIVIALILTIIMKKRRKDLSRNADYLVDNNMYLTDNKALSATNPCYHSKEHDVKEDLSQYYDTVAVDATYSVIKPQATTVICDGDDGYENMSGGQGNEGVYETIASEI